MRLFAVGLRTDRMRRVVSLRRRAAAGTIRRRMNGR